MKVSANMECLFIFNIIKLLMKLAYLYLMIPFLSQEKKNIVVMALPTIFSKCGASNFAGFICEEIFDQFLKVSCE